MADRPRMTAAQLANKLLASEHPDLLGERAAGMAAELMEAEVAAQIGAEFGQRTPSGWPTATATSPAPGTPGSAGWSSPPQAAPRLLVPLVPGAGRRAEQALVAVVQEADVNGISTRRVDRLVEQLGVAGLSKDQVSRLCRGRDEQVRVFWERPLEAAPGSCGWTPRSNRSGSPAGSATRRFRSPTGCTRPAAARCWGSTTGGAETEPFWREFLRGLPARGLTACDGASPTPTRASSTPSRRSLAAMATLHRHFLRDMLGQSARPSSP